MANINKIKLSGTTYNIQDLNATKTVELTQAQYDALTVKDPNTFYIITDAQGADLSQYYTSAQTESAITQAVSGKQDTLSAGTGIDITNNVISTTGSGGITSGEVQTMIDDSISGKADTSAVTQVNDALTGHTADTTAHTTSAEKTSWNGAATNASNAITALGGFTLLQVTQQQYDALSTKDPNTLYVIVN